VNAIAEENVVPLGPLYSVCQFTTPNLTFIEDLALYRATGATGIGLCETKLLPGQDDAHLAALQSSGLQTSLAIPLNIGPLPCEPEFPGPDDIDDRVAAMCESVRRLARFQPHSVVLVTGSGRGRSRRDAWSIAVEGLREAAHVAAECGTRISVEPLRTDGGLDLTLVSTLPETLQLIADIGARNVDIAYDVYHLWDTPEVLSLTEQHAAAIGGVHVNDWREPPRSPGDRLLPGDGLIDLPALFGALEAGGFDGWYDLEIFSDQSFADSLWKWPARQLLEHGYAGFLRAWEQRHS
jgi:sugar phosphate isomerase/epimerase